MKKIILNGHQSEYFSGDTVSYKFARYHELPKQQNILDSLNDLYEKTGNVAGVAIEAAKNEVTRRYEFDKGQTAIFYGYWVDPEDNRWKDDNGRTMEDLFDKDEIGGDRLERVLEAERGMELDDSVRQVAIFSEDLGFGRSYVQLITKKPDGQRQAVAWEYQGSQEEFHRLQMLFAINANQDGPISFSRPVFFAQEVTADSYLEFVKQSYSIESEKSDFLSRLQRDVQVYELLEKQYQDQVNELAEKFNQRVMEGLLQEQPIVESFSAALFAIVGSGVTEQQEQQTQVNDSFFLKSLVGESAAGVIKSVMNEIQETGSEAAKYIQSEYFQKQKDSNDEKQNINIVNPREFIQDIITNPDKIGQLQLLADQEKKRDLFDDSSEPAIEWRKLTEHFFDITPQQSQCLLLKLETAWRKTKDAAQLALLVKETGNMGAAVLALDALATLRFLETDEPVTKEIDGQAVIGAGGLEEMVRATMLPDSPHQEDALETVREERGEMEQTVLEWAVQIIRQLDGLTPEQAVKIMEEEEKKVQTCIGQLWEVVRAIADDDTEGALTDPEYVSAEEHTHVEQFSLAVTLWVMFTYIKYTETLSGLKQFLTELRSISKDAADAKAVADRLKRVMKECLVQSASPEVSSPWLLLSIIWHLAMIREQGAIQGTSNKGQATGKSKTNVSDNRSGIIFPPVHDMISV